jgi:hypothetical protein
VGSHFTDAPAPIYHYLFVRPDGAGGYSAGILGLPEIRASAPTAPQALQAVLKALDEWLATTRWVQVRVPDTIPVHPATQYVGRFDPNDPLEQMYLEELARLRREDLERTLSEYDQECPDSSSTPTT